MSGAGCAARFVIVYGSVADGIIHVHLVGVLVGGQGGDHLDGLIVGILHIVDLAGLDMDELAGGEGVLHAVHHDVHLALQDEKVLLHHVMVVGLKVLPGQEAHQGEVHPGPFHQVLGPALAKAVFPLVLADDIHRYVLLLCRYRPGAIHMLRVSPWSHRASCAGYIFRQAA